MLRTAAICLLALLPLLAGAQEGAGPAAETLALEEAVAMAQANNRQIKDCLPKRVAGERRNSGGEVAAAASIQFLPPGIAASDAHQLRISARNAGNRERFAGALSDHEDHDRDDAERAAIGSAVQPLSQLYRLNLNVHLQQAGKKLQAETLRQQRHQVTDSVKTAYYNLLQLESGIEATEESIKSYQELDRTTVEYVLQKKALEYQSLGVKAQLAQSRLDLVTLEDNCATQKENLNDLLGRDIRTDFRVNGVPSALPEEITLRRRKTAR